MTFEDQLKTLIFFHLEEDNGCKLRPLVNAYPCILTNRGSETWHQIAMAILANNSLDFLQNITRAVISFKSLKKIISLVITSLRKMAWLEIRRWILVILMTWHILKHHLKIWSRCQFGLIGNPVKFESGPAAVTGDEICNMPLTGFNQVGRRRN